MREGSLRRLFYVLFIVAVIGLLASLYSSAWAQPGQQGTVPTPTPTYTPTPTPTPAPPPVKPTVTVSVDVARGEGMVVVDADVGTSTSAADGNVTIEVRPGSVPVVRKVIKVSPKTAQEVQQTAPSLPSGLVLGSTIVELKVTEADGTDAPDIKFLRPVKITVRYTTADVQLAGGNPLNIRLLVFRERDGAWQDTNALNNILTRILTVEVSRFSLFAVAAQAPAATPTPAPTPAGPPPTGVIPPAVGDVAPGPGMLVAFLVLAVVFVTVGGYYLRPKRRN